MNTMITKDKKILLSEEDTRDLLLDGYIIIGNGEEEISIHMNRKARNDYIRSYEK